MSIQKPQNEAESCQRFAEMYERPLSAAARAISLSVLGHDWGVNGYTTLSQANTLSAVLESQASVLLEIGSGNGWPGKYVARALNASIVVTDVPTAALRQAENSSKTGTRGSVVHACGAEARQLPFQSELFGAVLHSDVLC